MQLCLSLDVPLWYGSSKEGSDPMPIYWIFIILAVIVAINAERISKLIMGTGKGKQIVIASCIAAVAILTIIIKKAL